jgi:hypothetical protein
LFCTLSRGLNYISNANPACSCVYICKFQFRPIQNIIQFRPIHPPLGDFHYHLASKHGRGRYRLSTAMLHSRWSHLPRSWGVTSSTYQWVSGSYNNEGYTFVNMTSLEYIGRAPWARSKARAVHCTGMCPGPSTHVVTIVGHHTNSCRAQSPPSPTIRGV